MSRITHIENWKRVGEEMGTAFAVCGAKRTRVMTVVRGAAMAKNPHDANCRRCRKIRDGR